MQLSAQHVNQAFSGLSICESVLNPSGILEASRHERRLRASSFFAKNAHNVERSTCLLRRLLGLLLSLSSCLIERLPESRCDLRSDEP
jgi:hypothetical protein